MQIHVEVVRPERHLVPGAKHIMGPGEAYEWNARGVVKIAPQSQKDFETFKKGLDDANKKRK